MTELSIGNRASTTLMTKLLTGIYRKLGSLFFGASCDSSFQFSKADTIMNQSAVDRPIKLSIGKLHND